MKKLLNVKNLIVALVLVVGLTGIASFVSASQPIATISYGTESINISSGDRPQIKLHEFGNVTEDLTVKFKISTNVDNFELTLTSLESDSIDGSMDDPVPYTFDTEGNIEVDLSKVMNSIDNGVQTVYTLNFIDTTNSGDKNFSIDILVDKKAPEVNASIGTDKLNKKGRYTSNELTVTVRDENFNPEIDYYNITVDKEKLDGSWKKTENNLVQGTFKLPQGENSLSIEVTDAAGNATQINESIIVDSLGPEIKVIIDNKELNDTQSPYYTNKTSLSISITDPHLDLSQTTIIVGNMVFKQNEDGTFGDEKCIIDDSKGILNLTLDELSDGQQSVKIATSDTFENNSDFNIDNFVVDTEKPWIKTILFNDQQYNKINHYEGQQTVTIVIDEKNLNQSGLDIKLIKEKIQPNSLSFDEENEEYIATFDITNDGEYTLDLNVTDLAGNKGDSQSLSFMIDSEAPKINLEVDGNPHSTKEEKINLGIRQNLTIKSIITDANLDLNSVEYSLDKLDENTGDKTTIVEKKLIENQELNLTFNNSDSATQSEEGTYILQIHAKDKAGRISTKEITFSIDRTRPVVKDYVYINNDQVLKPIEKEDGTLVFSNHPTIIVQVDEAFFDPNGVVLKKDGKVLESSQLNWKTIGEITHQAELSFTQDGIYTIEIDVKDKADNVAEKKPNTLTFVVDTAAPEITIDGYEELSNSDQSVNLKVSDLTLNHISYEVIKSNNLIEGQTTVLKSEEITITENDQSLFEFNIPIEVEVAPEEDVTITVTVEANDFITTINNVDEEVKSTHTTTLDKSFEVDKVKPVVDYAVDAQIENEGVHYFKEGTEVEVFIKEHHFNEESPQVTYLHKSTKDSEWNPKKIEEKLKWEEATDEENTYRATYKIENEGYYSFNQVSVVDNAGNEVDKQQPTLNLAIDKTPPQFVYTDVVKLSNEDQKLTIKVKDITYKDLTYTVTKTNYVTKETDTLVDNVTTSESELVLDEHLKTDGTYHVKVTAVDWAGNSSEISQEGITFTIDKVAPVVSHYGLNAEIREDNGIRYYSEDQEIKVYIDEYHFDSSKVKIDLTGEWKLVEDWKQVKDPNDQYNNQYVATIKVEKDGYYELNHVDVIDQVGNEEEVKAVPQKFVIDKVKPVITVSDIKNDFYYKKGDKVTINVSIDETNFNKNLSTYTIYRKESLNSEEKVYLSGNITSQTDFKLPTLTENGEYRVVLTAKDMSDNQVAEDTKLHFYIDHHDPKVSIKPVTANTANGSQQNVSEVVIGLSATDDWKLANTKYTVKRNNEVINVPKQGEWEDFKLSFKDEGYYQVEIETGDEAGTKTVKETLEFTIDRTSPAQLSIVGNANHHNSTTSVKDGESYSAPRVNLQFTAQDAYSFNKITVDVTKNGKAYASQTFDVKDARKDFTNAFDKNANYSLSEEGEYEVTFTAYDQAGNQSNQKLSFEIDRTTPIITSNIEDGKYYNEDFLPEFTLDQPERDEFAFINIDGKNYKDSVPFLINDKVYTISALATDKAQNTVDYNATITIDKTNPTIGISNLITGFFKDTLSPSIFYNDTNLDASKVSIKLNNVELGAGVGDENGYTKAINIDKDGNYTLEISIGDLATNVSKQTIDFVLDNEKPVIKIKNKISLHNQPWIPELEVLEEHGYDIVMATLNGEEYDITQPITTEGKNVLFLQVADKSGNTESITVEFILDLTPPKVIIENAETNQLVKDGDRYLTSLDLKIYLDYIEGESQEYTETINTILLNDEPQNLEVTMENGRKVYHLPLSEFKDYTLTVKATDSAGNETVETVTFTLGDKDIFTKIYENKPVFYSIITIAGLSVVGASIYFFIILKNKGNKGEESSEE